MGNFTFDIISQVVKESYLLKVHPFYALFACSNWLNGKGLFIYSFYFSYLFAIYRQAGPVQLQFKAGLNGGLHKQNKARPQHRKPSSQLFARRALSSLTPLANQCRDDAGDGAYGFRYRLYQWRLECLTIFGCQSKERTFSPVILRPRCWSGLGLEPTTFRTAVKRSTTRPYHEDHFSWVDKFGNVTLILFGWAL